MIPTRIIRSKRKTLSLTIDENAELVIRAPLRLSIKKIQDFINEKEGNERMIRIKRSELNKELKQKVMPITGGTTKKT